MSAHKILITGSGRAAADALGALARRGFRVEHVADPGSGLQRLLAEGFDLALLGEACASARRRLCAEIRERCGELPILLIGAASEEIEQIGLPQGADDFVVREFDTEETCARVRSLLRRARRRRGDRRQGRLACGPLRLDPAARSVEFAGRAVELTAIEFRLLSHLVRAPQQAASRSELLQAVWGYEGEVYSRTLTTHVNRLRSKLEEELGAPRVLQTVRGQGYRISS